MQVADYGIFFDYKDKTYRLPVNPEQIEISRKQAVQTYDILKYGQIAIPTHLELTEYSFECEFPKEAYSYVETPNEFKNSNYYLSHFQFWRKKLVPVRFIVTNGKSDEINTLVLIEDLKIIEKAGEEGDKYVSFSLREYKPYGKRVPLTLDPTKTSVAKDTIATESTNPKSKGTYVVQKGDTLWGIAKKHYGNGAKYTIIYEANKDKIKNPNLIYSGLQLTIPS